MRPPSQQVARDPPAAREFPARYPILLSLFLGLLHVAVVILQFFGVSTMISLNLSCFNVAMFHLIVSNI